MTLIDTSPERIREIRGKQARYFHSGATLDTAARKANLKALEKAVLKWEKPLCDALWSDLHGNQYPARRTPYTYTQDREVDETCEETHAAEDVSVSEQGPQRAARHGIDNITLELSCAAAAYAACRCDFGGLHGCAQTFALCSDRVENHRRNDC